MEQSIRGGGEFIRLLAVVALMVLAACGGQPPKEDADGSKTRWPELPGLAKTVGDKAAQVFFERLLQADKPPPTAPMLRIDVTAAVGANRGPGGQGLPIVVRLFELKAQGAFGGADFYSLYDREAQTLGGEFIAREELTLIPGQTRQILKPLDPQARYLGVLGAFRDIDRANWRALIPLAAGKDNNLDVAVDAQTIRVQAR